MKIKIKPVESDIKSCNDCSGWGKVRIRPIGEHDPNIIKSDQLLVDCPKCNGKGKIKK